MTELTFEDLDMVRVGHKENRKAMTGVSVLYFPEGAHVGSRISGGGPASRETPLTLPETADNLIHAVVLSGGSAYGLGAADGVMRCLEAHHIGFDTGGYLVPLVVQSDIYDLSYGDGAIRPFVSLGFDACMKALTGTDGRSGQIGAGTGATVGKIMGMKQASKSGLGSYAVRIGDIVIAAVVVVNALGDVVDSRNGQIIAGLRSPDRSMLLNTEAVFEQALAMPAAEMSSYPGNTTIGCLVTNARFSKAECSKLADMTTCAYARAIRPVGTMADGDTVYYASAGNQPADINIIGTLSAIVMEEAIRRAVTADPVPDEVYLKYV